VARAKSPEQRPPVTISQVVTTPSLTPDELLSTTRAVRRRLDLTRPVEHEVLEECLRLAQQAPSGSNAQKWHFVVVTDPATRAQLGALWRRGAEQYIASAESDPLPSQDERLLDSVRHLAAHIHEVPVHVIPCVAGRTDGEPAFIQAGRWASIMPAAWSFMLAARARGLGTAWTSFHLASEREAARIVGIPYEEVMQAALIPVAYSIGETFKPARRRPLGTMVHWDAW
jgi:nitroreductase